MLRPVVIACFTLAVLVSSVPAQVAQSGPPEAVSLQAGDVIEVEVWREEDLSGEFLVDESGNVVLPLVGERKVTGIPIRQLRDELIQAFRVELENPSIIITPLRRVYVLGEVNEPGLYTVDPTISLAGAVAMAGGATASGDPNRIRVIRNGQVIQDRITGETALDASGVRSGDQIFIDRRSWFDRNSTFLVSAMLSVTSIVISILR